MALYPDLLKLEESKRNVKETTNQEKNRYLSKLEKLKFQYIYGS